MNNTQTNQISVPVLDWMGFFAAKFSDRYRNKVSVYYETDQYITKTADCAHEIELVLKLRHQIFYRELQNKRNLFKIELDRLDLKCDHLLIIEKASDTVVGCYRLLSSHFFKNFYSESEFDLSRLMETSDAKLELGRACILPAYRNGAVIQLLWRGITSYMQKTDSRYLMGCSSVQTMDPIKIAALSRFIGTKEYAEKNFQITPTQKYHPHQHNVNLQLSDFCQVSEYQAETDLPPLIQSYLFAGAKLAAVPAVDADFNCIDFFTLLDRENMNPVFKRRYFGK